MISRIDQVEAGGARLLAAAVPLTAAAGAVGQVLASLVAWAAEAHAAPVAVAVAILAQGGLAAATARARPRPRAIALALGAVAALVALIASGVWAIAAFAAVLPGLAAGLALPLVAARLPAELDGWMRRRPVVAVLWCALAAVAAGNTARLSIFMVDDAQTWASFFPPDPDSARHQCSAAYVRAGELAASGSGNVYDYGRYRDRGTVGDQLQTGVAHLRRYLSDPFEYPPVFLLLPRAGLALSSDFDALRAGWFAIQAVLFLATAVLLASWVGGRAGAVAALLVPALLLSIPLATNLQYGQFHLSAISLSVAGFLAFAARRDWLGGGLLAAAIGSKIFPGAILVHVVAARGRGARLRPIAATCACGAILVAAALVVVGPQPFEDFFVHHLPRLASGEAFAFVEEARDNHSPYSLVFKLRALGVPGMGRSVASAVAWLYLAAVLVLVVASARRPRDRAGTAMACLALLSLAALRSPFAPTYAAVSTLWLFTVWAGARRPGAGGAAELAIAWLLLQGVPPFLSTDIGRVLASLPGQAVAIAAPIIALWPRGSRA